MSEKTKIKFRKNTNIKKVTERRLKESSSGCVAAGNFPEEASAELNFDVAGGSSAFVPWLRQRLRQEGAKFTGMLGNEENSLRENVRDLDEKGYGCNLVAMSLA